MSSDPSTGAPAPPSVAPNPAPPAYEPPAVAWEERLETIAATSCGMSNPFAQDCQTRPVA